MIFPGMSSCEYTSNTLRYADRVKELSHQSGGGETQNQMEADNKDMKTCGEDSDHNLSEDEEEDIFLNKLEAIAQIAEQEEKASEQLRELRQGMRNELDCFLGIVDQPVYNLEAFVSRAEDFIEESSRNLVCVRETLDTLGVAIQRAEQASKEISRQRPW